MDFLDGGPDDPKPIVTHDDAEYKAWLAAKAGPTHDDAEFQQWKASQPTPAAPPAPRSNISNALSTFDNALTMGVGQKFNAAFTALGDKIRGKDTFTHSFNQNLNAETQGIEDFRAKHPIASTAAGTLGGAASVYAAAPLAAAGEVANGLSMGARAAGAAKMGGAFGAIGALGNAPNSGGVGQQVVRGAAGGIAGAALGAGMVPAAEIIGQAAQKVGRGVVAPVANRLMATEGGTAPRIFGGIAPSAAAEAGAVQSSTPEQPIDRASKLLIERMQRAGLSPSDAINRAGAIPADKPVSVMELAGDQSHPVRQLGKWVARTPSTGQSQLRAAVADRSNPLPNAQRVLGDVGEAMGVDRTNLVQHEAAMKQDQIAAAKPFYDRAFSDEVPPVPLDAQVGDGPALAELLKRPSMKNAVRSHNVTAAERGEEPLKIPSDAPPEPSTPSGPPNPNPNLYSNEQWAGMVETMRKQGIAFPGDTPAGTVRDTNGRLRRNLSDVPEPHLEDEWRRLAEINANEEALHSGVQDAGYRADYEELPRTEKLGRKGQEDLPDADGTMDPDVLAGDNKIISDYRRSAIVRAARSKAMDRIQSELSSRSSAGDAGFGAEAADEGPQGLPLKSLQSLKFQLDEALDFANTHGRLPDGSPATNQRMGAINDTRRSLVDILNNHEESFKQGNLQWGGDAAMQTALKDGRQFMTRPISELQSTYPKLTPGEQQQHNIGAVSGPIRDRLYAGNAIDRSKMISSPDMQERLGTVVSPEKLTELQRKAAIEHEIALTNQAIPNGSDTYENALNDADANGKMAKSIVGGIMGRPRSALRAVVNGVVQPAIDSWVHGINEQTANALAPKLSAGMMSRDELNAMLNDLANKHAALQRMRTTPVMLGTSAGTTLRLPWQNDR